MPSSWRTYSQLVHYLLNIDSRFSKDLGKVSFRKLVRIDLTALEDVLARVELPYLKKYDLQNKMRNDMFIHGIIGGSAKRCIPV